MRRAQLWQDLLVLLLFVIIRASNASSGASCSSTHVLNPHTSTCLRVAVKLTNWHQAKSHCEASGEKLAVLDTKPAFDWFRNYSTNQAWREQPLWIAGRGTGSSWRWFGRITTSLPTSSAVWYNRHPYSNDVKYCTAFSNRYNGLIQRDCGNIYTYYPLCEKNAVFF